MKLFHSYDPEAKNAHRWHFCYLHGKAENHNEEVAEQNGWEWDAPDLFLVDEPMPRVGGNYIADLYGKEVVIVVAMHLGHLGGRAAINDPSLPCYKHAHSPEEWA
jgi:hypothetical protein